MKARKLLSAALFCLVLSGCADATEPDTLGFAVAIGIDVPPDGEKGYSITLQFANPSEISGGSGEDGGNGGKNSIECITVTAPEIYSAVNTANHIVSKTFVLSHTKLIVFSDEVAENGIKTLLDSIGRSSDIRPDAYFAVSRGKASDFLNSVNPSTEVNPVRYYTMIFENDGSGFVPQNMSADFYFFCESDEKCCVMPLCAVSDGGASAAYGDTGYQYKLPDYIAGEISRDPGVAQVMGTAVFDGDRLMGEMGNIETEMYNILTGQYVSGYVVYRYSRLPDEPIALIQRQKRRPKISVDTSGQAPKIDVTVYAEGDFVSSTPRIPIENDPEEFISEISAELKAQIEEFLHKTQEFGTDIVGFGSYAKQNFATIQDFSDYNWHEKYKSVEFNVNVNFGALRTGPVIRREKD